MNAFNYSMTYSELIPFLITWLFTLLIRCAINLFPDCWSEFYLFNLVSFASSIFQFDRPVSTFSSSKCATLVISISYLSIRNWLFFFFFFFSMVFKVNFIYLGFVYESIITLHLFFDESKLAALVTPSIFNFHLNSRHEVLTFRIYF